MTNTKTKIRSLFLTALMVFSVFAGSIAFAGTAAAANAGATVDSALTPDSVGENQNEQHEVEFTITDLGGDETTDTVSVELPTSPDSTFVSLDSLTVAGTDLADSAASATVTNNGKTLEISVPESISGGDNSEGDVAFDATFTVNHPPVAASNAPVTGTVSLIVDDTSDNQLTVQPTELDFEVTNVGDVGDRGSGYDIASSGQDGSTVVSGSTIFQGEEDLTLTSGDLSPSSFERTAGANEGETLSVPVPTDQPVGSYDDGSGNSFTVETPRIQNLEVTNQNGDDIAGGAVNVDGSTQLTIDAEYNFEQAEPLNVEIEDSGGLEVTDEVLVNPGQEPVISTNGEVTLALAEGVLDNEEYTVTVEGDEDLDFGDASQSVTFDVTTGEDASIEVQSDEVTRGENVKFEVDNAAEGDTHVVSIDADDVDSVPGSVFRNAGDTIATTSTDDGDALALVEIDDGVAVGSIDTSYLDETDVTVDVYGPGEASTQTELEAINDLTEDIGSSVDDDDFTVTEGGVMLENPQGSYVVGSETTVNGTTTAGVDNVALYARDEGDFEYLMTISVDGDDTFEEDDVVLSNPSEGDVANDTLSIPGSYRLAAVDADDSALSTNYRADQNTSAISEAVGMQSSIRVTDTALTVDYVSIVNGQVAVDDDLKINGTAPGQDEVSVSFYGPRGTYDRTTINVDSSDEFESENVDVGDNLGPQLGIDTELSQGNVVMSVFSSGRDGEAGDGQLDGYDSFPDFWTALNTGSNTQQQVIDQVASETTEDTGSDDISEVFQFRYTDGRVSVDSVTGEAGQQFTVETNDTMMVSGVTNRQPDDNTVTVEVIDGPSSSGFDIESTDVWGTDGQWSVEIPVEGVEPGNYTVEASVGGNTDIRSFQVTGEQLEEPTTPDEPTTDEPEPTTDEPEPTTDEPEPTTDEPEPTTAAGTDEPATTTETGPGFTAVLALVALVAAALLAVRRRD